MDFTKQKKATVGSSSQLTNYYVIKPTQRSLKINADLPDAITQLIQPVLAKFETKEMTVTKKRGQITKVQFEQSRQTDFDDLIIQLEVALTAHQQPSLVNYVSINIDKRQVKLNDINTIPSVALEKLQACFAPYAGNDKFVAVTKQQDKFIKLRFEPERQALFDALMIKLNADTNAVQTSVTAQQSMTSIPSEVLEHNAPDKNTKLESPERPEPIEAKPNLQNVSIPSPDAAYKASEIDMLKNEMAALKQLLHEKKKAEPTTFNYYEKMIGTQHKHQYEVILPSKPSTEAKQLGQQIINDSHSVYQSWGLIPSKNSNFTGRKQLLRQLLTQFTATTDEQTNRVKAAVAQGFGGVGKTQLAARYVHLCLAQQQAAAKGNKDTGSPFAGLLQSDNLAGESIDDKDCQLSEKTDATAPLSPPEPYNAILWLNAADENSLLDGFLSVANKIGLVVDKEKGANINTVRKKLYARLAHLPRVLLVFDDVLNQASIKAHLPASATSEWPNTCHCLLTTRDTRWEDQFHSLPVGVFSPEEARAYFMKTLPKTSYQVQSELDTLTETLHHLPLALTQAASYIRQQHVTISDYLTSFHDSAQRLILLDTLPQGCDKYSSTVLTTWLLSISVLKQNNLHLKALQILFAGSFLNGNFIEEALLADYLKQSSTGLKDLIICLTDYSLVSHLSEQKAIQIHGLLQQVIQFWLKGDLLKRLTDKLPILPEAQDKSQQQYKPLALITTKLEQLQTALLKQDIPHSWLSILLSVHPWLVTTAQERNPSVAELTRRKALLPHLETLLTQLSDEQLNLPCQSFDPESTASSSVGDVLKMNLLFPLVVLYHEGGATLKAKTEGEILLSLTKVYYGDKHLQVACVLSNLSSVYLSLGNEKKAKSLVELSLKIQKSHGNDESLMIARDLDRLGRIYIALGEVPKGKRQLEKALEIQKKTLGENHIGYADTLNNLANAHQILGDAEKMKESLEKALPIIESHCGNNHPKVAITLNGLACAYGELGKHEKKKELLEKTLIIQKLHFDEEHIAIAETRDNLACALGALGLLKEMVIMMESILPIFKSHFGDNHPNVAQRLSNLAMAYGALGEVLKAKDLLEEALIIQKNHYGDNNPKIVSTLRGLAMVKEKLDDSLGAFGYLYQAFQILNTTPGYQNHPQLDLIASQLQAIIDNHPDCAQLLSLMQQADFPEWQNNPDFQAVVGDRLQANNLPELALQYYELAIVLVPDETKVYHNVACCYHAIGRIKQAKHRFEQGIVYQPTANIYIEYAHFLVQQQQFQFALQHIEKSKKLPAGELRYGRMEKSVIHPLLQTLLESNNELTLPTDGLGIFLACVSHQALNQPEQATEALNQLQLFAQNSDCDLLAELAVFTLSLSFIPPTTTPRQQQAPQQKQAAAIEETSSQFGKLALTSNTPPSLVPQASRQSFFGQVPSETPDNHDLVTQAETPSQSAPDNATNTETTQLTRKTNG